MTQSKVQEAKWLDITDEYGEQIGIGSICCQYAIMTDWTAVENGTDNHGAFTTIRGPGIRMVTPNTLTWEQAREVVNAVQAGIQHDILHPGDDVGLSIKNITTCDVCGWEVNADDTCRCDLPHCEQCGSLIEDDWCDCYDEDCELLPGVSKPPR